MNGRAYSGERTRQADGLLERFGRLMRGLHQARGPHPSPWADCPLTLPQLRALSLLACREQGLIGRELAAQLGVGPSAITPLVDRLVEHGFVTRREDPDDRRVTHLVATDAGLAILARMAAGQANLMRDVLAHLEAAELDAVGKAFDILLAGMQKVIAGDAALASKAAHSLHHTSRKVPFPCTTHPS